MLENQKVVIIGGSSGIGLATARLLASKGAHLVIASRSQERHTAALAQIKGKVESKVLDFTCEAAVRDFFKSGGNFEHLVLMAAGLPPWGKFEEMETAALEMAFKTKFWGYFFCSKYALPYLKKDGCILFTIGGAARSAIPGTSAITVVNGAIMSMALTLARELAPIRVNILSPGLVDTPIHDWMTAEQKQAFFKQMGKSIPVGRIGRPEEIAESAFYLISNGYTTGAVLDVDGGRRLH